VPYHWGSDGNVYAVSMKIICVDRHGLLMDISTILGESKTNVSALKVKTMANHTAEIDVTVDVKDTEQLSQLMTKISNFSDVISITRMFGRIGK
jgi:GTP pyrophosphokinase